MIEQVFSMKTGRKANYFYMSSIIVSEGFTVTPGTEAAKAMSLHEFACCFTPRYYPWCQNSNEKTNFNQNPIYGLSNIQL